MRGIYSIEEDLFASQEGFCSVELSFISPNQLRLANAWCCEYCHVSKETGNEKATGEESVALLSIVFRKHYYGDCSSKNGIGRGRSTRGRDRKSI
jgi:hypothetical protein